jgi:hypothetical protein
LSILNTVFLTENSKGDPCCAIVIYIEGNMYKWKKRKEDKTKQELIKQMKGTDECTFLGYIHSMGL